MPLVCFYLSRLLRLNLFVELTVVAVLFLRGADSRSTPDRRRRSPRRSGTGRASAGTDTRAAETSGRAAADQERKQTFEWVSRCVPNHR